MRDRSTSSPRAGRPSAALDLVCCAAVDGRLAVLTEPTRRTGGTLPWCRARHRPRPLDAAALQWARGLLGRAPELDDAGRRVQHRGPAPLGRAALGGVRRGGAGRDARLPRAWSGRPSPSRRRSRRVGSGSSTPPSRALRDRMDLAPIAFRMLPATFTLSELQEIYELLLGRRLHKASFRRALQAAFLVEPTDAWRSEGRGRPAQLYRYAPRKRRGVRRSVRFELLG